MKKIRRFLARNWRGMALYGGLFAGLGTVLFWRLGTLLPGYAASELATSQAGASFRLIYDNPINAPFTLLAWAVSHLFHGNLLWLRVISASLAVGVLALFCLQLRKWHDTRTAVIGTILFGTSAWFLHTARLGTPDILMFCLFALVSCGYWMFRTGSRIALFCCFLLASALLYVPGMLWLIAAGAIWQWRTIDRLFKEHLWAVTAGSSFFVLALAPLLWAIYRDHNLIQPLLGLPHNWILAPLDILRNMADIPVQLFIHGYDNPVLWLRGAPILEIFSAAMLIFGGYMYLRHFGLSRTKLFGIIILAGAVLSSLGGPVTLTVIMPFVYLMVAAGITYVLDQWFKVFPRNPIAQNVGLTVMFAVLALTCTYHLRTYFVAWPQATKTLQSFTVPSDTIKNVKGEK